MIQRCYNPKSHAYRTYGGKGIKVCPSWLKSFNTFYIWYIKNGGTKGMQIDRINNDGNYSPRNCRIVTPTQNCRNKSNNCIIEYKGEKRCIIEWSEVTGIRAGKLYARYSAGMSVDKIFNQTRLPYTINDGESPLSEKQVIEIFLSTDKSKALAEKYGRTRKYIDGIREGYKRRSVTIGLIRPKKVYKYNPNYKPHPIIKPTFALPESRQQ